MASIGSQKKIVVSNFPGNIPAESIYSILSQYNPVSMLFHPATGSTDIVFDNDASADIALKTLNGRTLFGRKLVASRFSSNHALPPPFHPPTMASTTTFSVPPYTEQIGAHILNYASKRADFYYCILKLMQSLGLPPPPLQTSSSVPRTQNHGDIPNGEPEIAPGARVKRLHSDTVSSGDSTLINRDGIEFSAGNVAVKHVKLESEEQEEEEFVAPDQPRHLIPLALDATKSDSSKHLVVDISLEKEGGVKRESKGSLESVAVEVVPFRVQSVPSKSVAGEMSRKCVSDEELRANKMSLEQIKKIPRFEGWSAGEPSPKLFVKNLAPKANEAELRSIFGRYSRSDDGEDVKIRLMTKGKMHGQAFVTLPDREAAVRALTDVLGFLLHDRPMILEYGKPQVAHAE